MRTRSLCSRSLSAVVGWLMLVALVVGVPLVVAPSAGATPAWTMGISNVATGFTFVAPFDVAMSNTQRYAFVLDDTNRVVKVDTDTDTAAVLTSGGSIGIAKYIAVRASDGNVLVSATDSSGANPLIVVVDRNTGAQSTLVTGLGVAGPVAWDGNNNQVLTAKRTNLSGFDPDDNLVGVDSGGTVTDLGRPPYYRNYVGGELMRDVRVDPWGRVVVVWDGSYRCGLYFDNPAVWVYQGSPGIYKQQSGLWRAGRLALSPKTGMYFSSGGWNGSWNAWGAATYAVAAYPETPVAEYGYYGADQAYACSDQGSKAPVGAQPLKLAGDATSGNSTGAGGRFASPAGLAVRSGGSGMGDETQVFVTDPANNRLTVVVPQKILTFPKERFGSLASAGEAGDPVDPATGNFHDLWVDLGAQNGAFGMDVTRGYNSGDSSSTTLGLGWRSPFSQTLRQDPDGSWRLVNDEGRNIVYHPDGAGGWLQPSEFSGELVGTPPDTIEFPTGEEWSFDGSGNLATLTNWDGQSVTLTRNGLGAPTVATASSGPTLAFTYDGSNRLDTATSSDGRSVTYGYDLSGHLGSVTGPDGAITPLTSSADGLVATITDPEGVVLIDNTYDTRGRVDSQATPQGDATFTYDDATGDTTVTLVPGGETFTYHHDVRGRMTGITDGASESASRTYDANGWIASGVDRVGATELTSFDADGNPTSVTEPGKGTSTLTYDGSGRVLTEASPVSGTTTYTYTGTDRIPTTITDALGKVTTQVVTGGLVMSSTDPDGVTTSFAYNAARLQTSMTDDAGEVTTYDYDAAGRLWKTTTPEGRVTETTYDDAGRVLTQIAPDGGTTAVSYDDAGRVSTVTDPTLAVTTYTYNSDGLMDSIAKPGKPATTMEYDDYGQLTKTTDPTGVVTETTYGVLGRVLTEEDGAGRVTSYDYDESGNVVKVTAPDGGEQTTGYSTAGQATTSTDPVGRVTTTAYKTNGLVDTVTAPGGGVTTYAYDAVGRVLSVTDATGKVSARTYTDAGRVATTTDPAGIVTSFTYDNVGRVWKTTTPAGTTINGFDDDGLVTTVTSPGGLVATQTYDDVGRALVSTSPAGVTLTNTWSLRGELLTTTTSGRGSEQFAYNPDGTLDTATDARGNDTTYAYDDAGRMTSRVTPAGIDAWTYTNGEMTSYTPPILGGVPHPSTYGRDTAGRVKSVTDGSGRTRTDTFNLAGDITASSYTDGVSTVNHTFGYDSAGRQNSVVTPAGTYSRNFDAAGRMTSTNQPDGRYVQYTYDSGGRRQQTTTPEGLELVYSYDSAGRVQKISPNASMTDWFTGDNAAGIDPNKWTRQYLNGGTASIDNARMKMATTTTAGSSAGVTSKAPQTADETVTVTYQAASTSGANAGTFEVLARQDGTGANSYRLELPSDGTTGKLIKKVSGTDTQIGTLTLPTAGSDIRVQLDLSGTTVRAKAWLASGSTPGTWGVSVTDSSVTAAGSTQLRWSRVAGGPNSVSVEGFRQRNTPASALTPFVTYTYNSDSQITNEALAGGSRAYTYTNGRLTQEVQTLPGANRTSAVTYDSAGAVDTVAVTGGVTTDYDYDNAGQLTTATPSSGSTLTYTYDAAGRRTASTVGAASASYTYNTASQLTAVTPSSGSASSFTYDNAGRRTNETTGANTVDYGYDPLGQLTTIIRKTSGTITTKEDRAYNAEGLLRKDTVTGAAGAFLRYLKVDWDLNTGGDAAMVSWLDGESNVALVDGPGGIVATTKGNQPTAVAQDVFGSTINSTGQVASNATGWDPYGNPTGAVATNLTKLGFRGELTILGDTYLRAREYQANTGTFLTVDPLDDVAGSPTSGNRYHYSFNDPINREDPSGQRATDMDTNLRVCNNSGGQSVARFGSTDTSVCVLPPVTRTNGALCRPPFGSNGAAVVFDRQANACGQWLPGDCSTAVVTWICEHQSEIIKAIASTAVGILCAIPAAAGGPIGAGAAGNVCAGAVHRALTAYENGKNIWKAAFNPKAVAKDAAVGAAIGAATAGLGTAFKALKGIFGKAASGADDAAALLDDAVAAAEDAAATADDLAGAACRANSFVPSTLVLMADGSTKPIEEIEIGDLVLATDPETGQRGPRRVTDLIVGEGFKELVDVEIDGETVTATDGHPFWVVDQGRWVNAGDLEVDDTVLLADGTTAAVDSVHDRVEVGPVHNLTVEGIHTYYVLAGDEPVLVHNCTPLTRGERRLLGGLADLADEKASTVLRARGGGASNISGAGLQDDMGEWTLRELAHAAKFDNNVQAERWIKMLKQAGSQGKGGK